MYYCNKCGYSGETGPDHTRPGTAVHCGYHAMAVPLRILPEPTRMAAKVTAVGSPSCVDCRYMESWGTPNQTFHLMCTHHNLLWLIAPSTNRAVRCNETREFNFACGVEGRWFEAKGGYE